MNFDTLTYTGNICYVQETRLPGRKVLSLMFAHICSELVHCERDYFQNNKTFISASCSITVMKRKNRT